MQVTDLHAFLSIAIDEPQAPRLLWRDRIRHSRTILVAAQPL